MFTIREFRPDDERRWLECRLLGFFDTNYYDDVKVAKTQFDSEHLEFVAESGGVIVGLIDVEIDGDSATIDSIAVLPTAQRQGIASALLDHAISALPQCVATIDAWTRESEGANAWYRAVGFTENYRYLHVYKGNDEPDDGFESPMGLSRPVVAFMHAEVEDEARFRHAFKRVYVCRQYVRALPSPPSGHPIAGK